MLVSPMCVKCIEQTFKIKCNGDLMSSKLNTTTELCRKQGGILLQSYHHIILVITQKLELDDVIDFKI